MSLELSSNFLQFGIGMANGNGHSIYEFDHFRLDAAKLMLYRAESEVQLPPKVIKTLAVMVENAGDVLSKDEVMEKVWEGSIVEEANLSQYLYLLRKTLGQMPDGRPYIETLRRRGYRFNGEVSPFESRLETNGNSKGRPSQAAAPREVAVERRGNVLRLVDWVPETAETAVPGPANAVRLSASPTRPTFRVAVALALVAAAAVVSAAIVYLWLRPSNVAVESRSEMSVTRLTSGAFPYSAAVTRDGKFFAYTETEGDRSQIWLQAVGEASRIKIAEASDEVFGTKIFSPDGKFLYYVVLNKGDGAQTAVYRMPMMGGPSIKVLDDVGSIVSFSPDGNEIAFRRTDPSTGASSIAIAGKDGDNERTIIERKEPILVSSSPAWSPDGRTIIFAEYGPGGTGNSNCNRLYAYDIARRTVSDASSENWDTMYSLQWLRDGKGIVFIGTRENESVTTRRDQVYFVSLPDGVSRLITTDAMRHEPASLGVTDDGSILTVMSNRSSQIWSMNADGDATSAVQLSRGTNDGRSGLAPMPDGTLGYITYTNDDVGIWSMKTEGSDATQLTGSPMIVEELRPDPLGRYFIFSQAKDRHNHLYRINTDGTGVRQLTFGEGYEVDSSVSPDGVWVAYGSIQDSSKGTNRLFRSSIDGGESFPFGDNKCSRPTYSPDGQYLVCVTHDDRELILVSAADGSRVRSFEVGSFVTINSGVRWLPDSTGLVYIRSDKGRSNLWVQPLDGEKPVQLTNFTSGIIFNFAFAADGSRIYLARGYPIQDVILIKNFH
jgi:Tol biopolymer transport system component/DNA-binding winged helix-turn-helix (wHTH) protein